MLTVNLINFELLSVSLCAALFLMHCSYNLNDFKKGFYNNLIDLGSNRSKECVQLNLEQPLNANMTVGCCQRFFHHCCHFMIADVPHPRPELDVSHGRRATISDSGQQTSEQQRERCLSRGRLYSNEITRP